MNREYPDTLTGRVAAYMDMIGEEHGHPRSLDHGDMGDNARAVVRLLEGTVLSLGEVYEVGASIGAGAAGDVMVAGHVAIEDLGRMFQGVFVAGAALGARIQAGLHQ